ncbi:MAG: hypothetical protein INQ03_08480 [Candidatus Heimdallarchaeota archaeon]|nr:hypothetical protein [Candidatus Heimdallarchaeota archaeon]
MSDLPTNRSDWASLSWQEAQHQVGRLLNQNGFMKLEEKHVARGSRADLIIIKSTPQTAKIGIIEVKCYNRVTPNLQKTAKLQACRYISLLYEQHQQNQYWSRKQIEYFVVTVFTKDYPVKDIKLSKADKRKALPEVLQNIKILSTTPGSLLSVLQREDLLDHTTTGLHEFF